ncbi:Holliday junction resolvase RecU [Tissierella carlieri]|uniref:Holliday junction resolvase RecU n=1 Tax=Tissierella carlieri TaxID=689904 RepID=UPI001C0F7DE1|nr:Holliday junction resolvase RecU [Tissierella carlieri]MBU5311888.1 Holliday junction resolvase RecU [Tissierella carlieri]
MKNYNMANKGRGFEEEVKMANKQYERKGVALVQKISTPWTVIRRGKQIVSAFPEGKSTLDFRGTVKPRIPVSFDCKETTDERGLPLANIADHQIDYMKDALEVEEVTFILCYMKHFDRRYFISGETVIYYWDRWKENKGKIGHNFIPIGEMKEIKSRNGIILDYLEGLKEG